ncbi:MAG: UDP-N-acetylglucosamine--N-acetylmuramyl-(pentapeptide) pyrophosphoryl-undecaprenol N-acetylglucosamine transferase [Actinomycetota bacterium]
MTHPASDRPTDRAAGRGSEGAGSAERTRVVVTGGGTAGHVVPAIAILEALVDSGIAEAELAYVGSRRGIEQVRFARELPRVRAEFLPISGLQRSLSPRGVVANLALPWRLMRSAVMAHKLMKQWSPSVVVSVGGYASVPMASAAARAGVPLVCVSWDRTPGLATRRQSASAAVCAVAFEGSGLPRAVVTGAPLRRRMRTLDVRTERGAARRRLGIDPGAAMVTIVGGSLGSRALNDAVAGVLSRLGGSGAFVRHVTGPRFFGEPSPVVPDGVDYQRLAYDEDIATTYAATDLLVCRAGAGTVAEIAAAGIAAVVVPWSGAADDHQSGNARWLADANAAVVVADNDTGAIVDSVVQILGDPVARQRLADSAHALGERHRSDALVRTILDAAS